MSVAKVPRAGQKTTPSGHQEPITLKAADVPKADVIATKQVQDAVKQLDTWAKKNKLQVTIRQAGLTRDMPRPDLTPGASIEPVNAKFQSNSVIEVQVKYPGGNATRFSDFKMQLMSDNIPRANERVFSAAQVVDAVQLYNTNNGKTLRP